MPPPEQVACCWQRLVQAQAAPFGSVDHEVVLAPGVQNWHALAGFAVPGKYCVPEMVQVAGPQTFALPPPPHVWGALQIPQLSVPPHPFGIVPQLSPAGQEVTGVHVCENAGEPMQSMERNAPHRASRRNAGEMLERQKGPAAKASVMGKSVEIISRPFVIARVLLHPFGNMRCLTIAGMVRR